MATRSANVMVRVEPEVKEQAEEILMQIGIPVSTAINMLYREIILWKGLPFRPSLPTVGPKAYDELTKEESDSMMATGLAQTKGRNDNSWDNKVTYDNQYVDEFKRIGILIDIKILWNSVIKVSKKENIYENKADESMTDAEAAKYEEEEIIRIAHLPD